MWRSSCSTCSSASSRAAATFRAPSLPLRYTRAVCLPAVQRTASKRVCRAGHARRSRGEVSRRSGMAARRLHAPPHIAGSAGQRAAEVRYVRHAAAAPAVCDACHRVARARARRGTHAANLPPFPPKTHPARGSPRRHRLSPAQPGPGSFWPRLCTRWLPRSPRSLRVLRTTRRRSGASSTPFARTAPLSHCAHLQAGSAVADVLDGGGRRVGGAGRSR